MTYERVKYWFNQDMEKIFVTCKKKKCNYVVSTCGRNRIAFLNFPTGAFSDLQPNLAMIKKLKKKKKKKKKKNIYFE